MNVYAKAEGVTGLSWKGRLARWAGGLRWSLVRGWGCSNTHMETVPHCSQNLCCVGTGM